MVFNLLVPSGAMGQIESMMRSLAYYGAVNPLYNLRTIDLDFQWNELAAKHALSTRTHANPDDPALLPKFFRSFQDFASAHCFSGTGEVVERVGRQTRVVHKTYLCHQAHDRKHGMSYARGRTRGD